MEAIYTHSLSELTLSPLAFLRINCYHEENYIIPIYYHI